MPEGDTVWRCARRLHGALAGTTLVRTDFRVPALAVVDLTGQEVVEVASRGKHLLVRLGGGLTIHSHLAMDGRWDLARPGAVPDLPGDQVRVVLETPERVALGCRLPVLDLVPTAREDRLVGHLGPDLLGADWDAAAAVRRLAAQPDRAIGPALLDQRNLAGIGNAYLAEVLFLRGVSPWTTVAEAGDLRALVDLARRLLLANRDRAARVTTGDPRPGGSHWVYRRADRPCRRCGTPIRAATQAEPHVPEQSRTRYWCPACQPEPVPASGPGP